MFTLWWSTWQEVVDIYSYIFVWRNEGAVLLFIKLKVAILIFTLRNPNVLILTTSNVTGAIDLAFVDRADIKQYIGPPSAAAIFKIYHSCINELMRVEFASIQFPSIYFFCLYIFHCSWSSLGYFTLNLFWHLHASIILMKAICCWVKVPLWQHFYGASQVSHQDENTVGLWHWRRFCEGRRGGDDGS